MATVGLLDWDLTYWQQPTVFNLELMKLAAHHKQQRNIVKMLEAYDQERYSKIIIRKDYDDDYYPSNIFNNSKSEFGGYAFSNNVYIPQSTDIERLVADTSIYEKMQRYYQYDEGTRYRFNSMIKSPHLRMSLDGVNIWEDWESQLADAHPGKTFSWIIHDRNISNIINADSEINRVIINFHSQGRRLGFKYPLEIHTDEQFRIWGAQRKLKYMHTMKLYKFFSDELFVEATNTGGKMECEYILSSDILCDTSICQIYLQAIFLREHYSRILLILADKNLVSPEQRQVLQLINEYSTYCYDTHKQVTMYDWAKRWCKWLKVDIINTFEYVRQTNYPLFKLFYECLTTELKDGCLQSRFVWSANGGTIYDKR